MFTHAKECRCCGSNQLVNYLDLGSQPLANAYHSGSFLPVFPLAVNYCNNCFHSQLTEIVSPQLLFGNYLYVSGTTATFRQHCQTFAENTVQMFLNQPLSVLDIAANDGTLLECFQKLNCQVCGVDPAVNLNKLTKAKNIKVIVDFWHENIDLHEKFDIITGTNVFAHVADVHGFLIAAQRHLKTKGVLILEFPYCGQMIKNKEFDTVYHEHLSYFLHKPFSMLVKKHGFGIKHIVQTPIHGGSIRYYLTADGKDCEESCILLENEAELHQAKPYQEFSQEVKLNKVKLQQLLDSCQRKLIGYGASAKGNTMLNYYDVNLNYIVDDNSLKWDLLTPGKNIMIKNPDVLKDEKEELAIVLLAWNFKDEIKNRIKSLRPLNKDIFINYVPYPYID